MIIYEGYYYFKKNGGKIIKAGIRAKGILSTLSDISSKSYIIQVKQDDPLEEQVKTVLHELAHLGLEGKNLDDFDSDFTKNMALGKLSQKQKIKMKELENKIDILTEDFYNRNPPLISYIRENLLFNNRTILNR